MSQSRLVVLASGEGSVFSAIEDACRDKKIDAEIIGLICSRDGIGAVDRAAAAGVACIVVAPNSFKNRAAWDEMLTTTVRQLDPNWIALAGFTQLLGPKFLKAFEGRVVNTHPSLLPKFGGQGMYGKRVYEAVLAAGEKETGITVHQVVGEYDSGPIVAQEKVSVLPNDTVETLSERVRAVEREFYPRVLADLLTQKH